MSLKQLNRPFEQNDAVPYVKIMIPIGAGFDIPTGIFLKGIHGQYILNGGASNINAITGRGNTFKSTILHHWSITAAYRMGGNTTLDTYDTESNIQPWHLSEFSRRIDKNGPDWINSMRWLIVNAADKPGEVWFDSYQEFMKSKVKDKKSYMVSTPFLNGYMQDKSSNEPVKMIYPSFVEIDSFSKYTTSDVRKLQEDNSIGDSGGNTIQMRAGLAKMRLITELQPLSVSSNTFCFTTAHFGESINMGMQPPSKQMQHMKQGEKIKGVPSDFLFLTDNCWQSLSSTVLQNDADHTALYPIDQDSRIPHDKDLNLVTLKQIRSKSGPSGVTISVVVSQTQGLLASLSEYHFLKTSKYFGMSGNPLNHELVIYPDVKLSRTKIRNLTETDEKLCRALNITSEYLQMRIMWHGRLESKYFFTMEQIYEGITKAGYDWNMILEHTRGWWTIDEDNTYLELSTMDILRMITDEYHPYWLEDDKKTIKKEYQAKIDKRIKS